MEMFLCLATSVKDQSPTVHTTPRRPIVQRNLGIKGGQFISSCDNTFNYGD